VVNTISDFLMLRSIREGASRSTHRHRCIPIVLRRLNSLKILLGGLR
jgi:hypothetical protein